MASFYNSPFSTFIRGAQTTIHEYKMMLQSIRQTALAGLLIMACFSVWQVFDKTTERDRRILITWARASVAVAIQGKDAQVLFVEDDGRRYQLYAYRYVKSDMVKAAGQKSLDAAISGFLMGLGLSSLIVIMIMLFFYLTGRKQGNDFHIRGARLGSVGELAKMMRKLGKKGTISLGGVRLAAEVEPTSFAMVGAPRTGKSVQIKRICKEIRAAKQRAIIYDYDGLYTQLFYRPGIDKILNPTDERSAEWRPWYDALEPTHYEQQAASLIPDGKSPDDFWPKAARAVYVALTRKLARTKENPTLNDLLFWALQSEAETVKEFLKGTEATASFSKDKTADSIMSHLATYIKSFNYLRTSGDPFSIREWVENERDDSWLFISAMPSQIDALRPLITLWIDIASSSILSLSENRDRRFWYIFDELYTVNEIPSLLTTLTNGPKYGACGILGYQSHTLLKKKWGDDGAEALTGGCATHCIYRAKDVVTAKWAQDALGEAEFAETNEGISYGATELRDGRTANIHRSRAPLVLSSEVQGLDNLQYYLSCGRGFPVVPIQLKWRKYKHVAETYIPRSDQRLIVDVDDFARPEDQATQEVTEPTFTPVPVPEQAVPAPEQPAPKAIAQETDVPLLADVLPEGETAAAPVQKKPKRKKKTVTSSLDAARDSHAKFLEDHFPNS